MDDCEIGNYIAEDLINALWKHRDASGLEEAALSRIQDRLRKIFAVTDSDRIAEIINTNLSAFQDYKTHCLTMGPEEAYLRVRIDYG